MVRFDRAQIAHINNSQAGNKIMPNSKRVAVPEKDTFKHIFENALKGNEMAAVLLEEWNSSCKPKDNKEEQVMKMIHNAVGKLFK